MKALAISLLSSVLVLVALALPQSLRAQTVPLVFQTTFNCPDWDQSMGLNDSNVCLNGDGIAGSGAWTTSNGSMEQITSVANYPGGAGGKGQRHWVGNGTNNNSGGIRISFPTTPEFWIRWYVKFEQGLQIDSGNKLLYINQGSGQSVYVGHHVDTMYIHPNNLNGNITSPNGTGWSGIMGGILADGQWHLYELHMKAGTTNGIAELWVDEVKVISVFNVDWNTTTGWDTILIPSNGSYVTSRDYYQDIDDVAVSTTGYIGPISPSGLAAPRNLRVQ